jgi:hypothetical protein
VIPIETKSGSATRRRNREKMAGGANSNPAELRRMSAYSGLDNFSEFIRRIRA